MFYVAFVLTNIVVIFQIAVNLRCYRKLVLELRRGVVKFEYSDPLIASIQAQGYLIINVIFIYGLVFVILALFTIVLTNDWIRVKLWDLFGNMLLGILYFKLFDMILVQKIILGLVLTDGYSLRGKRDGCYHFFYGIFDFIYLFFSIINGSLNAIVRLGLMLVFSLVGPIFPNICTYPGFTSSFDSAYQAYYAMAMVAETSQNPIVITSVEIFRQLHRLNVESNLQAVLDGDQDQVEVQMEATFKPRPGLRKRQLALRWQLYVLLFCNRSLIKYRKKDTREAAADVEERELADNIGDSQLYEGNQENGDRIIFSNPLADDDHKLKATVKTQSTGGEGTLIL